MKNFKNHINRRQFVKLGLWAAALSQVPFGAACSRKSGDNTILFQLNGENYELDLRALKAVQDILFPKDDLGPGALELKADSYLLWVLSDPLRDPRDNEYILNGFSKLQKQAKAQHARKFELLDKGQQERLIEKIALSDWGGTWLSILLTFIFESMFANPNYGSNPEGIGWKWLNHLPGMPQPDKAQIYPEILAHNRQKFLNQKSN